MRRAAAAGARLRLLLLLVVLRMTDPRRQARGRIFGLPVIVIEWLNAFDRSVLENSMWPAVSKHGSIIHGGPLEGQQLRTDVCAGLVAGFD